MNGVLKSPLELAIQSMRSSGYSTFRINAVGRTSFEIFSISWCSWVV